MDSFQGASFSSKIFFLLPEDFCCKRRSLRYRSPIRLPALSSLPAKFPLEIWTPFKEHRFFGNSFFLSGKFPHHLRLLRYRSPIRLLALSSLPAKFPLEIWTQLHYTKSGLNVQGYYKSSSLSEAGGFMKS
ncbi:hypothetical protein [Eubacterium callanderi]|uniref:hypothetical protein n=1 Tax=Eubacterium callanderi TaxID=53442 RepID=UPI000F50A948|nr:hypothetical protein [Eubacterium callanderi]